MAPCGRRRRSTWKMPSWRAAIRPVISRTTASKKTPRVDARLLGSSGEAVDDHELDVGGVAHLAPAELAEAQDRDGRHAAALVARHPVLAGDLLEAGAERALDHGLGEIGDRRREGDEVHLRVEQVPHVGEQHLLVLEGVQHAALLLEGGAAPARRASSSRRSSSRPRSGRCPPAVEHRQQVLGLAPQEVLPQEGARPEQARELAQPLGRRQQRQRRPAARARPAPGRRAARTSAAPRAGSGASGSRCVNCLSSATAARSVASCASSSILPPVAGRDQEAVAHLAADARDLDLLHVDAAHRERGGERVEEAGRVGAAHLHPREVLVLPRCRSRSRAARARRRRARRARSARPGGGRGGRAPRRCGPARRAPSSSPRSRSRLRSRSDGRAAPRRRAASPGTRPRSGGRRAARPVRPARARQPPPAPEHLVARGRRAGRRGVDVARLDVERRRGEQPAEQRELGEEVEPDDRDVEPPAAAPRAPSRARAATGRARRRGARWSATSSRRVPRRVVGAHALHELADCPGVVAHTPPRASTARAGKSKAPAERPRRQGGAGAPMPPPAPPACQNWFQRYWFVTSWWNWISLALDRACRAPWGSGRPRRASGRRTCSCTSSPSSSVRELAALEEPDRVVDVVGQEARAAAACSRCRLRRAGPRGRS